MEISPNFVKKGLSEKEQLNMVSRNGYLLRFMDNPSETVQLAAVTQNGWSVRDIDNPSDRVKVLAEICKAYYD